MIITQLAHTTDSRLGYSRLHHHLAHITISRADEKFNSFTRIILQHSQTKNTAWRDQEIARKKDVTPAFVGLLFSLLWLCQGSSFGILFSTKKEN
mmetsp:Transcript_21318/g.38539  ORF Transcript_21318/g.38539 Transcript_21318/m.38539 type:complete len:95 (-) Transcript_21318:1007-1291(-)